MVVLEALKKVIRELPEGIRQFGLTPQDMMRIVLQAQALLLEDRQAYKENDPVSRDSSLLDGVNCGFQAVAFYRIANQIQRYGAENDLGGCSILAKMMSERAKVLTGVEINESAQIGPGLVIDHGYNTVIGATVTAGRGLYMLHNVTLGALGAAGNPTGMRHPQLGDDVRVGANTLIIGPVRIGTGADIRAGCLIASDVPDHAKISLQLVYQMMRMQGSAPGPVGDPDFPEIYGLVPVFGSDWTGVRVFGRALAPISAALIDGRGSPLEGYADLKIVVVAPDLVEIEIADGPSLAEEEDERKIGLKLTLLDGSEMILSGKGLTRVLRRLKPIGDDLEGNERWQTIAR